MPTKLRQAAASRFSGDDLADLLTAATEAITLALDHGRAKGFEPGHWLDHRFDHHLEHAVQHVDGLFAPASDLLSDDHLRTDLSHGICRLVMAWAIRERNAAGRRNGLIAIVAEWFPRY
jgi:hypothetical protein